MINTRGRIRSEIVRIIRALKSKDSPLDGEAREAAKANLKTLRKRERRVMKTASQTLASRIADTAKRHGAGAWQLEKLSENIKDDEPWLRKNWAPGMLVDAIRWQAEQVELSLPSSTLATPHRDAQCVVISPTKQETRRSTVHLSSYARECGYEDHADKNAARNISIVGIEKIIADTKEMAPNGAVQ